MAYHLARADIFWNNEMAIKKIITYPNPVLRKKTSPVTVFDHKLKELVMDMAETMYDAPGAGLAANQIGVSLRVLLVDNTDKKETPEEKEYLALINPEIVSGEGKQIDEEGCLSVIDLTADVKRFEKIVVTAQDVEGNTLEFEADEFMARVIQHEVDHLNGILFIDHLSSLKRTLYKKRLKKLLSEQQEEHDGE